ncbi:hypothetical protein ABXS75_18320 [Roseburia hominis]
MEYQEILQQNEYGFIRTNEHLGKYVILFKIAFSGEIHEKCCEITTYKKINVTKT